MLTSSTSNHTIHVVTVNIMGLFMNIYRVISATFLLITSLPLLGADLAVTINDIEHQSGELYFALFTKSDTFPDTSPDTKGIILPIEQSSVTAHFTNLPADDYAIAVFHDQNNNQELDKNFFGIPKEPYGFSDNTTQLKPPSFDEAKITLADEDLHFIIKLK